MAQRCQFSDWRASLGDPHPTCRRRAPHILFVVPARWRDEARQSGKLAPYIMVYAICDRCAENALRLIGADATGAGAWEGVDHYPHGDRSPRRADVPRASQHPVQSLGGLRSPRSTS